MLKNRVQAERLRQGLKPGLIVVAYAALKLQRRSSTVAPTFRHD
jgi:hypothetical protein